MADPDQHLSRIMREHPGLNVEQYAQMKRTEELIAEAEYTQRAIEFEKKRQAEKIKKAYQKALKGIKK